MKRERWLDEKVFYGKDDYFAAVMESISKSRHSIEVETYILEFDRLGKAFLEALVAASLRGVRVRLVVDGMGSFFWINAIKNALQGTKVEFRVYHPFSIFGRTFAQINRRLHRKICLVDHQLAFIGSFNVTDRDHRDTGVKLSGDPVRGFWEAFERLWQKRFPFSRSKGRVKGPGLIRLNESKRMRRHCNQDLTRRMREAKTRIWITNAYFVPPFFLLRAICLAALRGVEVRLLLPAEPDHLYMKWMSEAYYQSLILSGVHVFEYQARFLHAKSILIDHDFAMVGSTNLNHRSLIHDLEVDVLLLEVNSRVSLQEQFERDLKDAHEVTLQDLSKSGLIARFLRWFLQIFRFWT